MDKNILSSMEEILRPVTNVNISITEHFFKSKFLPLLLENKRKEFIKEWLKVCKNPYYPVEVKNKLGERILLVPPILKRQRTRTADSGLHSFVEIMERVRQKSEVFPKKGEKFFKDCMEIIDKDQSTDTDSNEIDTWETIINGFKPKKERKPIDDLKEDFGETFKYEEL